MDQTLFHLINEQWTNPALDLFMAAISNVDIWKPLIVLLVLSCVDLWRVQRTRAWFSASRSPARRYRTITSAPEKVRRSAPARTSRARADGGSWPRRARNFSPSSSR